jgi:molecular chaperone DnaK (HSP70)
MVTYLSNIGLKTTASNKQEVLTAKVMEAHCPSAAIDALRVITVLTEGITKIDNEIKVLQQLSSTNNLEAHNLNQPYHHELPIKTNLRESRLKLARLANKTVNMSKKIKDFYDNTNIGDVAAIKAHMHTLQKFLKESMPILQEFEAEYKSAIEKLETFSTMIFDFETNLKKMVDKGDTT